MRRGGKRDFSPYLNRGLEVKVTVRSTREKFVDPTLVDTKAGNSSALWGPSLEIL